MPNEKFWKYLNLNERKYENTLKLKFGKISKNSKQSFEKYQNKIWNSNTSKKCLGTDIGKMFHNTEKYILTECAKKKYLKHGKMYKR